MNPWILLGSVIVILGLLTGLTLWWESTKSGLIEQGYSQAMAEIQAEKDKANEKVRNQKRTIRHETQSLDRSGIVIELCRLGVVRNPASCPAH